MSYWQLAHSGPTEWDVPSLAEAYIADVGTAVTEDSVRAWIGERVRTAEYSASILGTSRAAAATATSWSQAAGRAQEITAAVRQLASPGADPDETEIAAMDGAQWAQARGRYVKSAPESEKAIGMWGEGQVRVDLGSRQAKKIFQGEVEQ